MEVKLIQRDNLLSNQKGRNIWKAECPYCGKIFSARKSDLTSGHTKSCGCISRHRKQKVEIGDKFGLLTILGSQKREYTQKREYFICQCQCGNITAVRRDLLLSGNTISCGCQRFQSKGEKTIENLLIENNIPFEKQKTFETCRFPWTNILARFDFYVNNQYIIEYDGQQHFKYRKSGWNTKQHFQKTQQYDQFKNEWCKNNNIPIIRIPYWKLKELTINDLILS